MLVLPEATEGGILEISCVTGRNRPSPSGSLSTYR